MLPQVRQITRILKDPRSFDNLCILAIFIVALYEIPATVIAELGASFGLFDYTNFYSFRVTTAAIAIGLASLNILLNHRYLFKDIFFLLYLVFIGYMFAIIWSNNDLYGRSSSTDKELISAMEFWLPILFKYVLFFLLGFYLARLDKSILIFRVVFLLSLCLILFYVDFETMGLDTANYVDTSFLGNYLFIGDLTSIAALISIAFLKTKKNQVILAVVSAIAIFYIGSRTSFAVFGASVFLYFVISFKPKLLIASCVVLVAIAFALTTIDYVELEQRNPRMFGILVDYQEDGSVQGREQLEEVGLADIVLNPISGNFGGQLETGLSEKHSTWRSYIHGALSYWRQFGILAIAIVLILALRFLFLLWKNRGMRDERAFALCFLTGVFLLIEAAFSRSFAFTYTHLFFGLTIALSYSLYSDQKSKANSDKYYKKINYNYGSDGHTSKRRRKRRRRRRSKM